MQKGTKTKCPDTCYWTLPALCHLCPLQHLHHSVSSYSFLVFSYLCGGFPWMTCSYLTDNLGRNDSDPGNSGSHTHCIAPRRAPKCARCYFSISLYCFTHTLKSLPIFDFLWHLKQHSEENWSVQCSRTNQPPWQRRCQCKLTHTGHANARKLWWALRK